MATQTEVAQPEATSSTISLKAEEAQDPEVTQKPQPVQVEKPADESSEAVKEHEDYPAEILEDEPTKVTERADHPIEASEERANQPTEVSENKTNQSAELLGKADPPTDVSGEKAGEITEVLKENIDQQPEVSENENQHTEITSDNAETLPSFSQDKPKVRRIIDEEPSTTASYPHYLPTWDHGEKYPPWEPFTHTEHAKDADPSFKDLLIEGTKLQHLTPTTGSEVTGVQLSKLGDAGKDQLALLVAQRKVVAFRDQDLADLPIQEALDFGAYFGRHHIHPTSGAPEGYPEIHLVYRNSSNSDFESFLANRNSSVSWHSDVTYEAQPPGTTFLIILDTPEVGGDTAFVNHVEAYNRLSPAIKERLHGLTAVHSGFEQAEFSKARGGVVRREPVKHSHPLVRTHPATGEKALFINGGFTRTIDGLRKEESEALLAFLLNHISRGIDYQARIRWAPKTVVVWDNRVTSHSAIVDWTTGERRHLARITPQAERPYETPYVPETKS